MGPDTHLPRDQALTGGHLWAHLQLPSRTQQGVNRQVGALQPSPTTLAGHQALSVCAARLPMQMLARLPPNISLLPTQIPTQAMRLLLEQL